MFMEGDYFGNIATQVKALVDEDWLQVLGPLDSLSEYWEKMLLDLPSHPLCGDVHKMSRSIPITLWGDEGTVNRNSWMISNWSLVGAI